MLIILSFSLVCIILLANNTTNHCFKFINSENNVFIYFFLNFFYYIFIYIYIYHLFDWNNSIAFII